MVQGPLGFPRVTNVGPFTEVEATQEYGREIVEEKQVLNLLMREASSIHDMSFDRGKSVNASLTVREELDRSKGGILDEIEQEVMKATRDTDVSKMLYVFNDDVAVIRSVKTDDDFRNMGLATTLKKNEISFMEEAGVKTVYTDIVSEGGYRLADRTGFRPIYEATHIDFTVSQLQFNDRRGVMFRYL